MTKIEIIRIANKNLKVESMNLHIQHSNKSVGNWNFAPGCLWDLPSKPNRRTLFFARWFLGWKWEDKK